jgi:3-oxoacyl-[acyl-carrier protein] reductase
MEIEGKSIIVTGAAGGIGSCTVKKLLEKKALVAAVDINERRLEALKNDCRAMGHSLHCYCGDIGDFAFVQTVTNDFFKLCGKIDALVNNASVLRDAPLASVFAGEIKKYPLEEWDKTIRSNLYGTFYFAREVAEKMILKRTRGVIINVGSVSSAGNAGQSAYAAAKAGVNSLTVTWTQELAQFGIRVAGIAPGMVNTDMPRKAMNEKTFTAWINKSPARRIGTPDEIAEGILFILKNDFFYGRTLELDGGLRM